MAKDLNTLQKETRLLEWIARLEAYAKEQRLPARISDGITWCQNQIKSGHQEWSDLLPVIEDILTSIELKIGQDSPFSSTPCHNSVMIAEVENQIKIAAQRCHQENMSSVSRISGKKDLILRECRQEMEEITYTKAHLDDLLDKNRYLHFFENIQNTYEKENRYILREVIEKVGKNGSQMMDHLKSLFHHAGGSAVGIGNQKFYQIYETNRENLENQLISQAFTMDFGSGAIMEFAQKTEAGVRSILRKLRWKKRLLTWLPLLLLTAVCGGAALSHYPEASRQLAAEAGVQDIPSSPVSPSPAAKIIGLGPLASLAYFVLGIAASLGSVFIFLILLCLMLYAVYLFSLQAWYKRQVVARCESYLKTQFDVFKQNQSMEKTADEAIESIVIRYEQQYLTILNRILEGTPYDREKTGKITAFASLRSEWEALRQAIR